MLDATGRAAAPATDPCSRCDLLLGLGDVEVEHVQRDERVLTVTVSTPSRPVGCSACGLFAVGRGRRRRVLHDVPGTGRVRVLWRQRVWRCAEPSCAAGTFVEQIPSLVAPRGSITVRAISWA